MQKFIVASSLVTAASGAAMPKMDEKFRSIMNTGRKTMSKTTKSTLKTSDSKKANTIALQATLKEEGIVGVEDHDDGRFFEVKMTMDSDCSGSAGQVYGMEAWRCVDGLEATDTESGMAEAFSSMVMYPRNEGFPLFAYFWGHGCNWDNLDGIYRIAKQDFGFEPTYQTKDCMPVYPEMEEGPPPSRRLDGPMPMFYMSASWNGSKYYPNYNAVMAFYDGRHRGCERGKSAFYDIRNADICMEMDGEDGATPMYEKVDVSQCLHDSSGGPKKVVFETYSDDACTMLVDTESENEKFCKFDSEKFTYGLMNEGWADLEYVTHTCMQGMTMM